MMFIDMVSYVGDVLSYYIDNSFNESLITVAEQEENVINIAQALGYKPKLSSVATTLIDVFMVIPSKYTSKGSDPTPDWDYALTILPGMEVKSSNVNTSDVIFRINDYIIFNENDPNIEVKVYEYDPTTKKPQYFLLKKQVYAYSATVQEEKIITPVSPQKYYKIQLNKENVIGVLSVIDSEGNTWYESPYLAQNTIFVDEKNNTEISGSVPYLLKLKNVDRRFVTRINSNKRMELQFGSGVSASPDEYLIPNPDNINNIMEKNLTSYIDNPLDPSNFMYTKTYGQVPYNTTLTIQYIYGGGIKSNVGSNSLTKIANIKYETIPSNLNTALINNVKSSIATNNPDAATGGMGPESIEEIRNNAMSYFSAQSRVVNKEDYITRIYSMPPKYGRIAKAYVVKESEISKRDVKTNMINNSLALNLYMLGYDYNNNLTILNNTVKNNVKNYLERYKIITDAVNIMNAYIINIAINFEIIVDSNLNKNKILLKCLDSLKNMFDINKWQINQPIVLSDIYNELFKINGVRNVISVKISNKFDIDNGYSGNIYDISSATIDGVIYPSLDPSCFEIKYPNRDIVGVVK